MYIFKPHQTYYSLTFANFRVVERQGGVLVESDFAELTLPALRVVGAVVAHAAADAAGCGVHRGVEVAGGGMVVTITL